MFKSMMFWPMGIQLLRCFLLRLMKEEETPILLPLAKFIGIWDCNALVYCTACFEKVMVETGAFNFAAD